MILTSAGSKKAKTSTKLGWHCETAYKPLPSKYALPPNWFNYLTQMLISDKISMPRGKLWKRYGPLHVYVPPKEYILALKILAGRDQDLADCRILLP
jgi:hypothetical protein